MVHGRWVSRYGCAKPGKGSTGCSVTTWLRTSREVARATASKYFRKMVIGEGSASR